MANPTILFNAGAGSDTAASGAGPGTSVTNTDGSFSGTTVTLPNADLSGVATDGSHILWLKTSTGRQFFTIAGTADSGLSTANVTVTETPAGTTTGRTYAIGGKRATLDHADSRTLFVVTNGAKPGWTIQLEDDQTISSVIATGALGDTTTGAITIKGDSASSRRIITTSANAACFNGVFQYCRFLNLHFKCSNATRTSSYAFDLSVNGVTSLVMRNCIFGDATNKLQSAWIRTASNAHTVLMDGCEVKNTLGAGVGTLAGTSSAYIRITNTWIHDCSTGALATANAGGKLAMLNCIVSDNTGDGLRFTGAVGLLLENCTIHNNSGDGIESTVALPDAVIRNCSITKNGGYGVNISAGTAAVNDLLTILEHCNFGSASDSTANTSGAVNGISQGTGCFATAPGYADAANDNYEVRATSPNKATGYPLSSDVIGISSATNSFVDVGAAQRQEAMSTLTAGMQA